MSCPNWQELAAHRTTRSGEEPEEYREALAHLDTCKACWSEALAADPSLLFRRLPEPPEATVEDFWDAEVASVQQAVAAMRTASRLEKAAPRRGALERHWKGWAAAAALATTVGGFGSWYGWTRVGEAVPEPFPDFDVPAASRIENPEGAYSQVKELSGTDGDDIAITMCYGQALEV